MESVEWEDYEWRRNSKNVYKMYAAGMSVRKIAEALQISYSSTNTLLTRGKIRQYYHLRTFGVPFEEALAAVRMPNWQAVKIKQGEQRYLKRLEQMDLEHADRIDKMEHPFYGMTLLVKHKQTIEALLESMNERASGLRNAVHDGGESHEGTAQRDAGEGLRQGA